MLVAKPAEDFVPSEVSIPITGMTCASCVRRIEKAIGKVAGVENVSVNLATERARVTYDPGQTTVGEVARAVERSGYGVVAECIGLTRQKLRQVTESERRGQSRR